MSPPLLIVPRDIRMSMKGSGSTVIFTSEMAPRKGPGTNDKRLGALLVLLLLTRAEASTRTLSLTIPRSTIETPKLQVEIPLTKEVDKIDTEDEAEGTCKFGHENQQIETNSCKNPLHYTIDVVINTKPFGNLQQSGASSWTYRPNGKPAMLQSSAVPVDRKIASHVKIMPYFEVSAGIRSRGKQGLEATIAVGLAPMHTNANMLVGLSRGSFAVHSDDGKAYKPGFSRPCLPIWKPGDVVGMGIAPETKAVYVTRNGVHMGTVFEVPENLSIYDFYPTVGVVGGEIELNINYGPSFAFEPSRDPPRAHAKPSSNARPKSLRGWARVAAINNGATRTENGFQRSNVEIANQIFARFDANDDGRLNYKELKNVIMHTQTSSRKIPEPLPHPGYINFCRLTGCESPEKGLDASQLWALYEEGYGTIDKDWRVLTGGKPTRPELLKATGPPEAVNSEKTGILPGLFKESSKIDIRKTEVNVDGGWSEWSECTHSCGWAGLQKRTCTEPPPSGRGKYCRGASSRSCNRRKCLEKPVWTHWSVCSNPCGAGVQFRTCVSDTLEGCKGDAQRQCKGTGTSCAKANQKTRGKTVGIEEQKSKTGIRINRGMAA